MRADVVRLVRQRRYDEALALLYQALSTAPGERELLASIAQIKQFLSAACAKRLGGLDRVAGPIPLTAATSPDAMLVARYIDGVSTFEDISLACPLGRLRTLQVLVTLYSKPNSPPSSSGEAWAGEGPASDAWPSGPISRDTLTSEGGSRDPWPPASSRDIGSGPASREVRSSLA
ncbi:MAG TPA: hypothetical protein VFS00_15355, partial [Polyangiaceae bacterium]|nr:hypothetical protein [Polyangiaceae bacterium]